MKSSDLLLLEYLRTGRCTFDRLDAGQRRRMLKLATDDDLYAWCRLLADADWTPALRRRAHDIVLKRALRNLKRRKVAESTGIEPVSPCGPTP